MTFSEKNKPVDNIDLLTARGLERRLKRHVLKSCHKFLSITTPGFENVLRDELNALQDVEIEKEISGGVEFCGPLDLIYSTNLYLRTANRVLMRIEDFTARSYPELYNKCHRIDWELYCGFSKAVTFSVTSKNSRLHHTQNIENAVFDALREHMEKLGVHVVNEKNASICFYIRFAQDECTVSIDSSGEVLYKRGYRQNTAFAPLRETIAGAVLEQAQWSRYAVLMDPMCGSGAIILEAVSKALHKAPGLNRQFAFFNWPVFNAQKWEKLCNKAQSEELENIGIQFLASDINQEAISSAIENAQRLEVENFVQFSRTDCFELKVVTKPGLLVSNLPYGKRIEFTESALREFFRRLGNHLRKNFEGWDFAFITEDPDFAGVSGLQVKKEISFKNGGIPVKLVMGEIR